MNLFEEKLSKRELERQLNIQRKREEVELVGAENEKLDYFNATFRDKYDDINRMLDEACAQSNIGEHFNQISREILTLQKYVAASSLFVRTYDIQKCQQLLQEVDKRAKAMEEGLMPKKKFGFKARSQKKPIKVVEVVAATKDEADSMVTMKMPSEDFCGFSDRTDAKLSLRADEVNGKDVTLERLTGCSVTLLGRPSAVHISHLRDCTVLCGPVSSSVLAADIRDSSLSVACQQLRLHSSGNVRVFLHVSSRAVLEDCSGIVLAPYNFHYEGRDGDFRAAGLDVAANNWTSVDDFNWLSRDQPSPNWRPFHDEPT